MTTNPEPVDRRQLLKDALTRLDDMQNKLNAVERAKNEPIAIIGMGCRFPGGANTPDAYWDLLKNGVDAVKEIPANRLDSTLYGDLDIPSVWYGGLLDSVDGFDAPFFGISPREATSLDPQQRLTLEVGWEALENAGIAPDKLGGSQTGVFMGVSTNDYAQLMSRGGPEELDVYSATGGALNAIPGRLAYTLGLNGPSVAIDTACSSSLVAIHLASQSLRSGESDLALAGGVNTILMPEAFVCFSRWGMMASDGRCKTFDARADGFVRSEGCGIVVLKRLSDALANGDTILALIRGSAVNQDGRSSGLTVPNGPAQQAVIRRALSVAKVKPADISYIETHGTGTLIGDPIEVEAIGVVIGEGRPKDLPLILGAAKSNIGHAESASGIAGLIKVVLSMQHGEIPRNLHFEEANPRIPWPDFPVIVPQEQTAWQPANGKRLAGISGFGFSGTNAHVVLEEAPAAEPLPVENPPVHILTISTISEPALRELASKYEQHLAAHENLSLVDAARTMLTGRAQFAHRLAVTGDSAAGLQAAFGAFARGEETAGSTYKHIDKKARSKVAFLFTGQGAQYVGMGRGLYETQPVFRDALDRCDAILRPLLKQPLLTVLYPPEGTTSPLDETTYTQPALFALEYALAQLWISWGIQPAAVMGHSVGEYVAACIAGVFSLEDGLKLIAERGRLMGELPAGGKMAAVFADEATTQAAIAHYTDSVSIAAVNGPENIVISGTGDAVDHILDELRAAGVKSRPLNVSHAFHSPLMDPILDTFARTAASVTFAAPRIALISNVTGKAAGAEVTQAAYWRQHIRQAVRFADAVELLHQDGYTTFLEVGPSPTLIGMGQRIVNSEGLHWLASLRSGRPDAQQIAAAVGSLYAQGVSIDWAAYYGEQPYHKLALPTYPFQREHFWVAPANTVPLAAHHVSTSGIPAHPLLGTRLSLAQASDSFVWENVIDIRRFPYLDDHRVEGLPIVPATAYMEMGMAAAVEAVGELPLFITEMRNLKPLFLRTNESYIVQVALQAESDQRWGFAVFSRPQNQADTAWTKHVEGKISHIMTAPVIDAGTFDPQQIIERCTEVIAGKDFYQQLSAKGNQWGSAFQGIETLWRGNREALSFVRIPHQLEKDITRYVFHPAVADSCGHVLTATIPMEKSDQDRGGAFVGGGVDETRVYHQPAATGLWCYARLHPDEPGQDNNVLIGDVAVFDEAGTLISETLGAHLWYLDHDSEPVAENIQDWFYALEWQPQETTAAAVEKTDSWLILADANGVADQLADRIQALGGQPVLLRPGETSRLQDILTTHSIWNGIIHLWSLDATATNDLTVSALDHAVELGTASALHIVQALHALNLPVPPRLWLVTAGAQSVAGEETQLAQTPLWGFGRTLALEHAEYWGGLIDLDPDNAPDIGAGQIWDAIAAPGAGDDQIAFRGNQRYAPRLVRRHFTPNNTAPVHCRPDGSYLITGGLGGLGLAVARWLARNGARRLILMGRTALPPRAEWSRLDADSRFGRQTAVIKDLEALGVSIHLAPVDVGDEAQLRAYIDTYQAEGWPPIRGVIHAAGVMQYQPMLEHTPDEMRRILQPKLVGGWLLHSVLHDSPLDFFVLYSSASALLNSPLIGSYAAANTFLDGLAHYRHALGQPALSVNWGVWGEAGMVVDFGGTGNASDTLMQPMSTQGALEALGLVIGSEQSQIAIMATNWKRWQKLYAALNQPPFLSQLMTANHPSNENTSTGGFNRQILQSAAPEERPELLEGFLSEQVKQVLGFGDHKLNPDESLSNLGIDSLMAVELKNRIENHLRLSVPMAQLLQGPSVTELGDILLQQFTANTDAEVLVSQVEDNYEEGVL